MTKKLMSSAIRSAKVTNQPWPWAACRIFLAKTAAPELSGFDQLGAVMLG